MGRLDDLANAAANWSSTSSNPMYGWRVNSSSLSGNGSKTLIPTSSSSISRILSSRSSNPPPFDSFGLGGRSNLWSSSSSSGKYGKTSTPVRRIAMSPGKTRNGVRYLAPYY